jgi:hypothetical protein
LFQKCNVHVRSLRQTKTCKIVRCDKGTTKLLKMSMSCTLTWVNKIWKKSTRQGDTIKQFIHILLLVLTFLPIRFSTFFFRPFEFRVPISAHSSFRFSKSFYRKKFFCFKNDNVMYAHYDKQNHVKLFDVTRETTKLLKMSMSCTLTRMNKICKKSTHQG